MSPCILVWVLKKLQTADLRPTTNVGQLGSASGSSLLTGLAWQGLGAQLVVELLAALFNIP